MTLITLLEKMENEIVEKFNKVKKLLEENPEGGFYILREIYPETEEEFLNFIKSNPEDSTAYMTLGWFYDDCLLRYYCREKEPLRVIEKNPHSREIYHKAKKAFEKAVELNPSYARIDPKPELYKLSNYAEERRLKELLTEKGLKKVISRRSYEYIYKIVNKRAGYANKKAPDQETIKEQVLADTHHRLGYLYAISDRYDEAEKELLEVIKLQPDNAEAHDNLGMVYRDLNRYEEAEKFLLKAAELNPNNDLPYENLSGLYRLMGKKDEAQKYFNISRELKAKNNEQ